MAQGQQKYHISEKGRYNICRAETPEKCRAKQADGSISPHFETKEEAKEYILEKEARDNSTLPRKLTKSKDNESESTLKNSDPINTSESAVDHNLPVESDEQEETEEQEEDIEAAAKDAENFALRASKAELNERQSLALKKAFSTSEAFDADDFKSIAENSVVAEYNSDDYDDNSYDSYTDYDDDYSDDYESEAGYTGFVKIDSKQVVNNYYNVLRKRYGSGEKLSATDENSAKQGIAKILNKHSLLSDYSYTADTTDGEVTLTADASDAMNDLSKIYNS